MVDQTVSAVTLAPENVTEGSDGSRPITLRWQWFRGLFLGFIIAAVAMAISNIYAVVVVQALFNTPDPGEALITQSYIVDFAVSASAIAFLVTYIGSVIAYAFFMTRSAFNARLRSPDQVTASPQGMWLWFFVPIANLFKPVQGVVQVWHGLHPGGDGPTTPLIPLWWTFWIIGSIAGNLDRLFPASSLDFALTAGSVDDYIAYTIYSAVSVLVMALAAYFCLRLASRLKDLQSVSPAEIFS